MRVESVPQRSIGRYVLHEKLGRGAMGVVFRAQDPLINRTVAVKILDVLQTLSPEQAAVVRERFLREAQTAGGLDHPNVVRIFDVGLDEESGELYIVMEFLPGASLEGRLASGPLSPRTTVELLRPIASALDLAHERGIIHRDIKPGNILFTEDGAPKITDFGIAHITSSNLTQDVRDLGTPVFMSPEQLSGANIDGRADLFSLGVLCYQTLAGRPPFNGKTAVAVAYQIVHTKPEPLSDAVPGLGAAADAVLAKILAKDPANRYASGTEFVDALAAALTAPAAQGRGAPARTGTRPGTRRRGIRWSWLAGAALAGLAILLLWRPWSGLASAPATTFPAVPDSPSAGAPPSAPPAVSAPEATSRPLSSTPDPRPETAAKPPSAPRPGRRSETNAPVRPVPSSEARTAAPEPPVQAPVPASAAEAPAGDAAPALPARAASLELSLGHWISQGTLTVSIDGTTVLSEEFSKKKILPYQTTEWEAVPIPSGARTLTARVTTPKGKVYVSPPYGLVLAPGELSRIRVGFRDDALTFKRREPGPKEGGSAREGE